MRYARKYNILFLIIAVMVFSMSIYALATTYRSADFNGDRVVDGVDADIMNSNWNGAGEGGILSLSQGNSNGDSFIDGQDLNDWLSQYGSSSETGENASDPMNDTGDPQPLPHPPADDEDLSLASSPSSSAPMNPYSGAAGNDPGLAQTDERDLSSQDESSGSRAFNSCIYRFL